MGLGLGLGHVLGPVHRAAWSAYSGPSRSPPLLVRVRLRVRVRVRVRFRVRVRVRVRVS